MRKPRSMLLLASLSLLVVGGCAKTGPAERITPAEGKLSVGIIVRCDDCDDAKASLVDTDGRMSGWRAGHEVDEIPDCDRMATRSEASTEGDVGEPATVFTLNNRNRASMTLIVEAARAGEAAISLMGRTSQGRTCAADGGGPVSAGTPQRWNVHWTIVGDSCVAGVDASR